ncbi:Gfo/Idh/MocA family oxidoreductase [Halobacillus sp. A1]|uniref:Gfo/Idh/MocA family protein n=1 Tax=Halobacillus sp. A1 TaxID=2880262 RepID=UPI0020A6C8E1|nr:Gfo/Idh/MocA family oxidoreductase [Halobacillus sp. A1]MCP3030264.1 Gfo/Idh/MocA family oxidoreductase [Halobacillus sp. A1]
MEKCGILIVGIAGYGELYVKALMEQNRLSWVKGVVDIYPEHSSYFKTIIEMGIPIFSSLEEFYEVANADLAIISTPIHLHAPQAIKAMKNGSHVLCEKPMSGSWQEAEQMRKVRDQTGRFLAVGFNWSFTDSVNDLKNDINRGLFGKPLRGRTIVLWPRNEAYYNRCNWAGKLYGPNGEAIFDSIANNAASHFFHHLLYVLGETEEQSAKLHSLDIELYRANPIETFDTCALRAKTDQSVELMYFASHALNKEYGPEFELEFEEATIHYKVDSKMKAIWHNGREKDYGDPESEHMRKLDICIQKALKGETNIRCGIEASYSHMLAIKSMHEAVPEIPTVSYPYIQKDPETTITSIIGLEDTLMNCYKKRILPKETDSIWTNCGNIIEISSESYPY